MKDSQYFQFRGTCNNEVTDYLALNWGGESTINKVSKIQECNPCRYL